MVKKIQKTGSSDKSSSSASASPLSGAIKDSAQQIWLAGLGAFSKAQEEGGKAFESLVKEGMSIQRKTQAVAEEKFGEVSGKMTKLSEDVQSKAGQQWDKLESIFEERVAKALGKLGVPSSKDVSALIARIDTLQASVARLSKAPAAKKAASKAAPVKAATKRAAPRKRAAA